jgi:hypothetical protein
VDAAWQVCLRRASLPDARSTKEKDGLAIMQSRGIGNPFGNARFAGIWWYGHQLLPTREFKWTVARIFEHESKAKKAEPSSSASRGQGQNRTGDTRLFRPLLYRLSYQILLLPVCELSFCGRSDDQQGNHSPRMKKPSERSLSRLLSLGLVTLASETNLPYVL